MKKLLFLCFLMLSFNINSQTSNDVDCTAGPITTSFCYDTGLDNSYSFTSLDGSPMNLTINSGQIESNWDELIILDSDGITNLNIDLPYGNGGDLSGLTFQSSGDNITLIVDEDGSVSCVSSGYNPIDFTVACATCVNPIATYTMVTDCLNGPQFFIDVDLTDVGSATSLSLFDNQNSAIQSATATGVFTFGPYDNNTDVVISVTNDDDANCSISSSSITQEFCTTTLVDCSSGPLTLDYCYDNNNTTDFIYTSSDGVPVNLTINSGNVESGWDEFIVYDSDGVTELTPAQPYYGNAGDLSGLTFQSTGDTISFVITSDGSVSCGSGSGGLVNGINYTVACATCINPQATYTVIDDCDNGDQFLIDVNVISLGDADSLTISDNQGGATQSATATGIYTFGPYPFLTNIVISVANDQDVNCVINSNTIQLFACPPANDNCSGAEEAVVNVDESCALLTPGTLTAASESPENSSCVGDDDDVWFEFTALSEVQLISLVNISGTTTNLGHGVYEGVCGTLTELYCSADNSSVTTALTIGNTYYIKVFSSGDNSENIDFDLCIKDAPDNTVCQNAANFCGEDGALYGANIFDFPSLGQIACLYSTPNPSWNVIQIGDPGTIDIQIVQNTEFDENGNAVGNGLDVDFVLWGPFDSNENFCAEGVLDQGCPNPGDCPNNTTNPNFYPSGNIVDCSYSIYDVENLTINDAQSGEIYVLLVTNYSNSAGTIQIEQTNSGLGGAGSTIAEIEVELGEDIEICGSSYELTADSPFADSYEWYQNGIFIEGANGETLTITESDSYTVIAYDEQCDSFAQDSVFVNFYFPVANSPGQLIVCDDQSMDGVEIFNLASVDETILGDQDISTYVVNYYISEEDALQGVNQISISFENTSNPQTIFARIENPITEGCFNTTSFDLVVEQLPIANFENVVYEVCPNAIIPLQINIVTNLDNSSDSYEISWTYNGSNLENENSLVLGVLNAGNYEFTLTSNESGCSYSESIDVLELESCVISQGISPNDDGYNDYFDLSSYNVSNLKVFNRNGTLVYSKLNYLNEWRGQSDDGDLLPVGTYFYVMSYDENKTKVDWVYLNY
ncbi:gliding motility-associated C-terminal domain-containing protein [Flavobacteriaceae bacterium]|nr:gliding motility-associated C-terminal domain-containing protein [Flavobacteriaceae bacterium]